MSAAVVKRLRISSQSCGRGCIWYNARYTGTRHKERP